MNPVSDTAYYCCGIRMEDAGKAHSVCSDTYAERFMDDRGLKIFEPFRSETMPNISNITRCRLIDDHLRSALAQNSKLSIITIGAGFDTRPYRLAGGSWLEIDEPQIIGIKNERLPVDECVNPLRRVPIDFANESLADKLGDQVGAAETAFVIEGVFMYLEPEAIQRTLAAIQGRFPRHVLFCDLMTRRFFERFAQSVHAKLVASGAAFTERPDSPEALFEAHGYRLSSRIPMFRRAGELGVLWKEARIPGFVSWLLLNVFRKDLGGYAVHRFEYHR